MTLIHVPKLYKMSFSDCSQGSIDWRDDRAGSELVGGLGRLELTAQLELKV